MPRRKPSSVPFTPTAMVFLKTTPWRSSGLFSPRRADQKTRPDTWVRWRWSPALHRSPRRKPWRDSGGRHIVGRTKYMPTDQRLRHVLETVIPDRLGAIDMGRRAIGWEEQHGAPSMVTLELSESQGGELMTTIMGQFTQPVILVANLSCRMLLNFLGIECAKDGSLKSRSVGSRRGTDIGIEHFFVQDGAALERLTPNKAMALLSSGADQQTDIAESWATVMAITNKRLAHLTDDTSPRGQDADAAMRKAFETVPELVHKAFLDKNPKCSS